MTEKKHNINKRKRKSLLQSTQVVPTVLGTTYPTYGLPVELNLFEKGGSKPNSLEGIAAANKSANPWDYVEDKDTVDLFLSTDAGKAYANSKNALGISKKFNPFSKMNLAGKGALGSLGKAGIGAITGAVGGFANKAISGGFSSGAGAGISSVGSTIGGLVSNVNPVIGGAVTLASNVVGGLVNRAFGSKVNLKALLEANAGTAQLNNFVSNASNFDSVQGVQPVANIGTVYEGGWFSKGDAEAKQRELERKRLNALTFAYNSVENNVNNLQEDQMDNMLRNFAAYGGNLDIDPSSPIGYALYTDKLAKDINKDNSSNVNMFAGMPSTMFDLGGILQTNGSNWGNAIHIDAGGSHEANPNDGVQIGADSLGIPNLVEENELIYNDYVFSDRLIVPRVKRGKYGKRGNKYAKGGNLLNYDKQVLKPFEGLTFAEAAKKIEKQSGVNERPNDPIAKRTFEANLSILARNLEKEREKEKLKEMLDAIDKMSPEDFMAMQQQALQLQELQLVINPAFMPLLALALQPLMAAYGGKLFAKGGNTDDESTSTTPPTTTSTTTPPSPDIVAWLLKNYAGKFRNYERLAKVVEDNLKKDKDYREGMSKKDLENLYGTVFDAMKNGTLALRQTPSKLEETPTEESPRVLKDGYEEKEKAKMEEEMRRLEESFALQNINFVPIEEIEAQRKKAREERAKAPKATLTIKMDKVLPASVVSDSNIEPNLLKPNINVEVPTSTTTPTTSQNVVRQFLDTKALAKRDEELERQKLELQMMEEAERFNERLDPFRGKSIEEIQAEVAEQLRRAKEEARATLNIDLNPVLPIPISPVENNTEPNINADINRAPVDVPQSFNKPSYAQYQENTDFADLVLESMNNPMSLDERARREAAYNMGTQLPTLTPEELQMLQLQKLSGIENAEIQRIKKAVANDYLLNRATAPDYVIPLQLVTQQLSPLNYTPDSSLGYDDIQLKYKADLEALQNDEFINWLVDLYSNFVNYYKSLGVEGYKNPLTQEDFYRNLYKSLSGSEYEEGTSIYDALKNLYRLDPSRFTNYESPYRRNALQDAINRDTVSLVSPEDAPPLNIDESLLNANEAAGNAYVNEQIADLQTPLEIALNKYKGYANNKNPNGDYAGAWTIGDDGKVASYSDDYTNFVKNNVTADKLREYANTHKDDPSLKSFLGAGNDLSKLTDKQVRNGALDGNVGWMHNLVGLMYFDSKTPKVDTTLPLGEVLEDTSLPEVELKIDKPADSSGTVTPDGTVKPDGTKGKSTSTNDNFPKAPMWPYYAGLGLLGLGLLHNWLTPVDYSNADAVIKAARNAGNYKPVGFNPIGNYLTYKPMDIWFELNRQNANSRATDRLLANSGSQGSRAANILANTYNSLLVSGDLYKKALEYNDAQRKSVEEFNRDTDKFNREGFLEADLANLKAYQGASALTLEGLKSGYAMRQAAEDAKSNAISAGLTGVSGLLANMADTKYKNDLLGWGILHNAFGNIRSAYGGKLRVKRVKKLSV